MEKIGIKKFDNELQVVYGEVYAPDVPDSQGDFMTASEIQKMAHNFLANMRIRKIDTQHNNVENGSVVVESFIARESDPDFLPGSWVVGVHVPDKELWHKVKSGEINGFSMEGLVHSTPKVVEIEVPEEITGDTHEAEGHTHRFIVKFTEKGEFLGGSTTPGPDGHVHVIKNGTVTEVESGHKHRYSFLDGLLDG